MMTMLVERMPGDVGNHLRGESIDGSFDVFSALWLFLFQIGQRLRDQILLSPLLDLVRDEKVSTLAI
jgi:hypothetical protein